MTATSLAQEFDASVQLVSYHLGQLAKFGFIQPGARATDQDRRQRWWRASDAVVTWASSDFLDSPSTAETAMTLRRAMLAYHIEQVQRYLSAERTWPSEWVDAAFSDDTVLELTHGRLQALHEELLATIRRYRNSVEPKDADARPVFLFMHGFPLSEPR